MTNIILGISVLVLLVVLVDVYMRLIALKKKAIEHDIYCEALYDVISFWMNYDKEKITASFETAKRKFIAGYAQKDDEAVRLREIDEKKDHIKGMIWKDYSKAAEAQEKYNKMHK
ncbi:MAG: hypothetical protein WCO09_00515 [bacterium]